MPKPQQQMEQNPQVFSFNNMIHDKAVQAISLVFYSILCAFIPVDKLTQFQAETTAMAENILVYLQIISVVVFLIIGLWKFRDYLKDRKKKPRT